MKKTFIIASLLLSAGIVNAQNNPPKPSMEEHLKRTNEMLQKELQMNDAQQKQVAEAFKEFSVEAEKLHKQFPPPPPPPMDPKMKEALDKLEQTRDEKVKSALNEDQYKKYKELEKQMRPPHPGNPPGDKPQS